MSFFSESRRPCVIARLAGGLGNQLFMYAFAKALAVRNGVPLLLDTVSGFARDRNYRRNYLLDHLIPEERQASRWQARAWPLAGRAVQSWDRRRNARRPLDKRDYLRERIAGFDADIHDLAITRPVIVDGYWQTERYFDDLPLRELIRFPEALTGPLATELAAIDAAATPVCLAVRRYEEIPRLKRPMVILDADYYHRAMARLEETVEAPHYFVFAQDMQWARANITSAHPITYASEKDPDAGAIQDLFLMTRCQHHILSNSTLHWWGAWLAQQAGQTVIAPARGWHNADCLPARWDALT
jgi:hypothetical protein